MAVLALDTLRELLQHMEWADAYVWRLVLACPPAARDARVRDVLLHLHGVQRAFFSVWTSQPPPRQEEGGPPDLAAAQGWARSYYQDLWAAVPTFDDPALVRPIRMPGLEPYERQFRRKFDDPTLAETMLQVTSHSTYHRAQVNARLRELGGDPPNVDYIAWIWFGRPAPEWPAGE